MDDLYTIKGEMDELLRHVKFNQALMKDIYRTQVGFINKNDQHMEFFGGNLTGVHTLTFAPKDYNVVYNDLLKIDSEDIRNVIKKSPSIIQTAEVMTDPFNHAMMYMTHRFLTSPFLNDEGKKNAAMYSMMYLHMKILVNLYNNWFEFNVDEKLARAAYSNMSNRFILKQLGSWQALLEYRSSEFITEGGNNKRYAKLIDYTKDYEVITLITDARGGIAEYLKNIYSVIMSTHKSGEKIDYTSPIGTTQEGDDTIKDKIGGIDSYINYFMSVVNDRNTFIKQNLVEISLRVMHTMQRNGFIETLEWITKACGSKDYPYVETFIRDSLQHSYNYLADNGIDPYNPKNIAVVLDKLKGMYTSSRSTDETLLRLREVGLLLIKDATGKTNEQTASAIRNGIFIYLSLRLFIRTD